MSSRFEKVIATAVMAGALTLTGCGGKAKQSPVNSPTAAATTSPTPAPTNTIVPDTTPPVLVDARTVNPTLIELTFSEAVAPGTVAPADFSLSRNQLNIARTSFRRFYNRGVSFVRFDGYARVVGPGTLYNATWGRRVLTRFTPKYSFAPPVTSPILNIAAVAAHPTDPSKLNISLGANLVGTEDYGTGMLRLTYTAPAGGGGIADTAGNAAASIALTPNDRGTVRAETSPPALIGARTLNATQIELSFSEPVFSTNPTALAPNFKLGSNKIKIRMSFWPSSVNPSSVSSRSAYYGTVGAQYKFGNDLVLSPQGMKATLTVATAIPTTWDNGTGHLRLTYSGLGTANALKDAGGAPLPNFSLSPNKNHRGNVVDTL
ncbi:MAG: hypothetical protein OEW39_02525 [Deltaproteobacteria bacterium]|nr:hypothetical protein [Deltaproteobacteria bacterium]